MPLIPSQTGQTKSPSSFQFPSPNFSHMQVLSSSSTEISLLKSHPNSTFAS